MTLHESHSQHDITTSVAKALEEWQEEAEESLDALASPQHPDSSLVAGFVGDWGTEARGMPSLTIQDDAKLFGSDGCNRLMSQGSFSGDEFRFGHMASTMMFCQGVDTWLSRASSARLAGGVLVLFDAAGEQIGFLDRR